MCRQRLEQVQNGVSSTFRDIKKCRDSIRSARTHIKMTMDWFEDELQSTDNPDSKKKIKEMIQNLRELDKQLKGKVL
jgi:rubrerythrin